jgi:hypothetical protein
MLVVKAHERKSTRKTRARRSMGPELMTRMATPMPRMRARPRATMMLTAPLTIMQTARMVLSQPAKKSSSTPRVTP